MDFKNNVIRSFRKCRDEMELIKVNQNMLNKDSVALKKSANEWIMHLVKENEFLKQRLAIIESKLEDLEPIKNFKY